MVMGVFAVFSLTPVYVLRVSLVMLNAFWDLRVSAMVSHIVIALSRLCSRPVALSSGCCVLPFYHSTDTRGDIWIKITDAADEWGFRVSVSWGPFLLFHGWSCMRRAVL